MKNDKISYPLCRRVHGCCRCRHCSFTATDTTALLDHFNSAHCLDSADPASAPANGCSAPSTLRIKEESKGDLKLYSLVPSEAIRAEPLPSSESVKSEAQDEKEKGWVEALGPVTGGGVRGGEQRVQSLVWVPKERAGEILRGSPAPFPQATLGLLNAVAAGVKDQQQQKGATMLRDSSGLIFSLSADAKGYLPGTPTSGAEKARQQYPTSTEGKCAKEESQSLLRVSDGLCLDFRFFLFFFIFLEMYAFPFQLLSHVTELNNKDFFFCWHRLFYLLC